MTNLDPNEPRRPATRVTLSSGHILAGLFLTFAFLLAGHAAALLSIYQLDIDEAWGMVTLFHLDREQNLPSLISGLSLMLSGALVYCTTLQRPMMSGDRVARYLLTAALLFLALDEWVSIHERLDAFLKTLYDFSGALRHAWVLPYAGAAIVFIALLGPWIARQERALRDRFGLALIVYLTGALGCEILHACYIEGDLPPAIPVTALGADLIATLEETLELAGLFFLVSAAFLLVSGSDQAGEIRLVADARDTRLRRLKPAQGKRIEA